MKLKNSSLYATFEGLFLYLSVKITKKILFIVFSLQKAAEREVIKAAHNNSSCTL